MVNKKGAPMKKLAETEAEMLTLAHQLGFKDLKTLNDHIKNDRSFYATSGQQEHDQAQQKRGRGLSDYLGHGSSRWIQKLCHGVALHQERG